MIGSSLVTKTIPASPKNYNKNRNNTKISEITLHHMAGNLTVETVGAMWQSPSYRTSSTYAVNGINIGQYVDEADTSFCNGNYAANCRAVTIEVANNGKTPDWPVSEESLNTLIKLVADIAKRKNLGKLVPRQNLTWHSMYCATACPGPFLLSKMQYIADEANKINDNKLAATTPTTQLYTVQCFAGSKAGADAYAKKINQLKIDGVAIKTVVKPL